MRAGIGPCQDERFRSHAGTMETWGIRVNDDAPRHDNDDRLRRYDVAITDHQLRCFRYRTVTRFGPNKAVYLASASHIARYKFDPEFDCLFIEIEVGPFVEYPSSGELDDRREWDHGPIRRILSIPEDPDTA